MRPLQSCAIPHSQRACAGAATSVLKWSCPSLNRRRSRWFPALSEKQDGLQVATAVRDLRHVRNLSQRQLAARMGVPRTYISKIENGKAMPTLSSLDRLARALKVDIASLLRDANNRHSRRDGRADRRPVPGRDRRLHLAAE